MIYPFRCYTCGKIVGDKWIKLEELKEKKIPFSQIFIELNIKRYCCKRILLTYVNLYEKLSQYKNIKLNRIQIISHDNTFQLYNTN